MSEARLFFRVLEAPDGGWVCRRGRSDIDVHVSLTGAIGHLRSLAKQEEGQVALYLHHLDGRVVQVPTFA